MKFKLNSKIIKEGVPLLIVIIFALLIFRVKGVPITNNSARYIQKASNISQELGPAMFKGDALTARRPLFPVILALGFKLRGKSVESASLVTRMFFTLQIILIYLLGRFFYDKSVGLLSSGLVLTSYGVNLVACYVNTDIVQPFFILLFILIYYIALTRSSKIWAVSAGIILGLALMVKESAWFCFFIPIGIVFLAPKGKRWEYGKLGFWVIGTMAIPLVLWAIYIVHTNDSFHSILDVARWQFGSATWRIFGQFGYPFKYWTNMFITGLPKTLFKYYQIFLQKVTPLSFLMIFGWFFVFIRGLISRKTSDLILTTSVICSLPIIIRVVEDGDRLGQSTMVYMFLYLTLSIFVVSCISLLMIYAVKFNYKYKKFNIISSAVRKHPRLIGNLLIILVGFFLIKAQLFGKNGSTWYQWTEHSYSLSIFSKKQFEVYGRYTIEQQETAEWLKKNASKNAKIIADGYTNEALDFFEVADYEIPTFHPTKEISVPLGSIKKGNENIDGFVVGANILTDNEPDSGPGVDLIQNGNFSADTDPPPRWTVGGATATLTTEANGQAGNCMMVTTNGAAPGVAYQQKAVTIGKFYKLIVYFKKGTATNGTIEVGYPADLTAYASAISITDSAWTAYAVTFKAADANLVIRLSATQWAAGKTAYFDEISCYEIPATCVAANPDAMDTWDNDNIPPLYFITYSNFNSGAQRHRIIFPIFEEDIMTVLKRENPDYLVISSRGIFLGAYFDKASWACLKFENHRARIYEIHLDRFEPVIFEDIGVNETIGEHLTWLEKDFPDEFLLFKEKIETLGLTIDELKNSQLRFPRGQVY